MKLTRIDVAQAKRTVTEVVTGAPTSTQAAPPSSSLALPPAPSAQGALPAAAVHNASAVAARLGDVDEQRFVSEQEAAREAFLVELLREVKGGLGGIAACERATRHADEVLAAVDAFVVAELGPPPSAYALLGAGSFGRRELSPYSDLDYAIALSVDTPEARAYFDGYAKRMAALFHKIAGEGLAPCREMSPTGTMKATFVGTPEELARRAAGLSDDVKAQAPREREFIMTGLSSSRLALARDDDGRGVHARFAEALREALGPSSPHLRPGSPRDELVDGLLDGMRDPFGVPARKDGWLGGDPSARPSLKQHQALAPGDAIQAGKVNVKHDLLRAIQIPVQALAAMYDLAPASTAEVLERLANDGVIDEALAKKLLDVLDACLRMRAQNQLELAAPVDKLRAVTDDDKRALRRMVPILFRLKQGMEAARADKNALRLA